MHLHPPGSRRVVPLSPTPDQVKHLTTLLQQDQFWVYRARWARWLRDGDPADTIAIERMPRDARLAARAWLLQQRHVLHLTVTGDPDRKAPNGWAEALPLARALNV